MLLSPQEQHIGLALSFGAARSGWRETAEGASLELAVPLLTARGAAPVLAGLVPAGEAGPLRLFRCPGWLAGVAVVPARFPLEEPTFEIYRHVFAAVRGLHLVRLWNYVPAINSTAHGVENYRSFCSGRARAFAEAFGVDSHRQMPAASAVGTYDETLVIAFLATEAAPRHFENPAQVPAWCYPVEHGPRPPSFARATAVRVAGENWYFVSGTSAIKGHATIGTGEIEAQVRCTLDNLRLISTTLGLGPDFSTPGLQARAYRVYLRDPADQALTLRWLKESLLREGDSYVCLQADICRAALGVEIEVAVQAGA